MGCWMGALGRLTIEPEPDDELIMEYIDFSKHSCPKDYCEDEVFMNPWFFDADNKLASYIGKFAEPSVWYDHLKENFFEPRGYRLRGDPMFVGECDLDIWKLGEERYREWNRKKRLILQIVIRGLSDHKLTIHQK